MGVSRTSGCIMRAHGLSDVPELAMQSVRLAVPKYQSQA